MSPSVADHAQLQLRGNPADAPWIIQKFGGTSLGKFAQGIAEEIVKPGTHHHRIAIVCSALSTGTKAEGTTSRLLRAAKAAVKPPSTEHEEIVAALSRDHIAAGETLIRDAALLEGYKASVEAECARARSFLCAARVLDEISPKTRDIIIGAGEKLSCLFMTTLLQDRGVKAEYVNLENIIHPASTSGTVTQAFYDDVAVAVAERVLECEDRVPVVTGFFGTVPGSLLAAVGRGYTDLCAALLAVGIKAQELQVWKEVDGIFTADPRKVPQAALIPVITPEETAELTYWGAEVIHPFTMEQVIAAKIPIRVKNVTNPGGHGTVIFPADQEPLEGRVPGTPNGLKPSGKRPTAVTTKADITIINVHSNRKNVSHGFLAGIFSTLDFHQLVVDLISTSEVHVSMALHTDTSARQTAVQLAAKELERWGTVDISRGLSIVAVVGRHMKRMVGVAGRMFQTLADASVNIEMISQGANEINISCVVKEKDALKAMTILHTTLFLYSEVEI
ncbi:Aspartate/glutamate/uridylate kinase [Sphaerosporella brunnea]|uniref:Aspartokinase n=1 Tax=Sphaerosporella brunnea TaxID=1250544 RepID=A0A5J5EPA1_9PEZI|nr:Aspartate/glutamate/uridylate kinase [Sphaerosporella brunnea]